MRKRQQSALFTTRSLAAYLLAGAALSVLPLGSGPARAWDQENHLTLVKQIKVPYNSSLATANPCGDSKPCIQLFDISFDDPTINLYVLADRTNASVDFFDAKEKAFIKRVSGFQGVVLNPTTGLPNNALSGPDGVVIVNHKEVWAGDGNSTLKVIDIATGTITHTIQVTDPTNPNNVMRVDEMSWDPRDHLVAAANNANVPPFVNLISTDTYQVIKQIVFDGTNGTPDATNTGIEQSQWSPRTGLVYVSVPQTDPNNPASGGVAVIDPSSMTVTNVFEADNCTPGGLALGPRDEALIGCSGSFGTPLTTQSLIINIRKGNIVATITEAGGNDEVWFDPGTDHYYLAARGTLTNGVNTPIVASVDARTNKFDGSASTSNASGPSTSVLVSAHSVAADKYAHHIFVPIGFVTPGTSDPTNPCPTTGCIAVFEPSVIDEDDHGHDQDMAKR